MSTSHWDNITGQGAMLETGIFALVKVAYLGLNILVFV